MFFRIFVFLTVYDYFVNNLCQFFTVHCLTPPPLLPLLLDAEREGETGSVCGQRGGVPGLVLHTGEDSSDIPGICNTVRKVLADFAIFN